VIRSGVTVSLIKEARGGPFVFWEDLPEACRKAESLGFDAIEIFPPGPDAIPPNVVQPLLQKHHLQLAGVGTGGGWVLQKLTLTSPDSSIRARAREFVKSLIDSAGALGAPAVVGSLQGKWGEGFDRETALSYLRETLNELGEHARQYHVPLLYEPLNRYETNVVNTLADGIALLRSLDSNNVKLLADLYHMNIEEENLALSLRSAGAAVGHVHFADSNRRPMGLGHTDAEPIAEALRAIGYQGFVSAECLPYPDSDRAAEATIRAFRRYFR
jgi:sugar phosphate isomerase/epimerase